MQIKAKHTQQLEAEVCVPVHTNIFMPLCNPVLMHSTEGVKVCSCIMRKKYNFAIRKIFLKLPTNDNARTSPEQLTVPAASSKCVERDSVQSIPGASLNEEVYIRVSRRETECSANYSQGL